MGGIVDPGFKCVAFDLIAVAAMADVCIAMRHEGKETGQTDRVPAAADVPVATEKKKQAYSEYKHVLANILHSLFVARTPPVEAVALAVF